MPSSSNVPDSITVADRVDVPTDGLVVADVIDVELKLTVAVAVG
jgi:hypothetical protein